MIAVPNAVMSQYDVVLKKQGIPISQCANYKKWLLFFLDFCIKYPEQRDALQRVESFLEKLREKKQGADQRKHTNWSYSYCSVAGCACLNVCN